MECRNGFLRLRVQVAVKYVVKYVDMHVFKTHVLAYARTHMYVCVHPRIGFF